MARGEEALKLIKASPRDAGSFSELIWLHLDSLYATALRLTNGQQDAEDLVQSTCLKALQGFEKLRDTRKAKSWLFRILTNIFIDEYRSEVRAPEQIELDSIDEAFQPWVSGPEVSLMQECLSTELEEALAQLHPEIRLVVWYVDVEGFTYDEVAQMLSCAKGTVASRLFRGRNQLKAQLLEYARNQGILRGNANEV